jgi:hypothetical protein
MPGARAGIAEMAEAHPEWSDEQLTTLPTLSADENCTNRTTRRKGFEKATPPTFSYPGGMARRAKRIVAPCREHELGRRTNLSRSTFSESRSPLL